MYTNISPLLLSLPFICLLFQYYLNGTEVTLQVKSLNGGQKNMTDHLHSPNILSSPPFNNYAASSLELN